MEIVRQRKKRLLAWILTVVLCVGMWQGNVMAEGEDGGDAAITPTEAVPTEVVAESTDPVVASETGDGVMPVADTRYSVTVSLMDEKDVDCSEYMKTTSVGGIMVDGKLIQWGPGMSGLSLDSNSNIIKGEAFQNSISNEITLIHNFLAWRSSDRSIIIQDASLDLDKVTVKNEPNSDNVILATGAVDAILGKCIAVVYHEKTDSSGDYNEKTITINAQEKMGDMWTVIAPKSNFDTDGKFFVNWTTESSGGSAYPQAAVCSYNEFEKKIDLYAQYTNEISSAGSYSLKEGKEYYLNGANSWSVGDKYTYSGDQYFYVNTDGSYNFSTVGSAAQ